MESEFRKRTVGSVLATIGLLALCAFLWPALFTFDSGDWPSPNQFPNNTPTQNACGMVGAWLAYHLRYWLGDGAFPLLALMTAAVAAWMIRGRIRHLLGRSFGLILVLGCFSAFAHMVVPPGANALPVGHGGVLGFALGRILETHMDRLGTMIVLTSGMLVGLVFVTEGWVLRLPGMIRNAGRIVGSVLSRIRSATFESGEVHPLDDGVSTEESYALLGPTPEASRRAGKRRKRVERVEKDEEEQTSARGERELEREGDEEDQDSVNKAATLPGEAENAKTARGKVKSAPSMPKVNFPSTQFEESVDPYPKEIENWRLPPPSLLADPEFGFDTKQEQMVRKLAQILEQTLQEFRLNARVVEIDTGPVITMFELKLGAGVKVSQIATLSNDIARALRAPAIRVVAPITGKNTVGIEVPNIEKETVRMRELMTVSGRAASDMNLPLFLGKDAGGAPLVSDLTKMPHLLIAGTTGSGKSVCLQAIILSLLMTKRPDHVKLIIIDPKMVEMTQFKDVPHLMCPIVTDTGHAERILEWAVVKMDERYEVLAEAGVKNIDGYNALGKEKLFERLGAQSDLEKSRIAARLPYIVVIIDELADLMMTAPREIEHHLARLAQKSRAVGIHIIVATQRPEAKIVTGLIKSNLPSRICFRVASRTDSRIVLDRNGGEVLLGQGDMLFLPPGSHKLQRAQGTYLEESEVHAVLDDLRSRAKPEFHPDLIKLRTVGRNQSNEARDPMFDEAVAIVAESGRGSVSLLQRRLGVGYSRASRLIEQMADAGLVGEHKGSQAREVFVTADQWEEMLAERTADKPNGDDDHRGRSPKAPQQVSGPARSFEDPAHLSEPARNL